MVKKNGVAFNFKLWVQIVQYGIVKGRKASLSRYQLKIFLMIISVSGKCCIAAACYS